MGGIKAREYPNGFINVSQWTKDANPDTGHHWAMVEFTNQQPVAVRAFVNAVRNQAREG